MASAIDAAICSSNRWRSGGCSTLDWFIGSTNIVDRPAIGGRRASTVRNSVAAQSIAGNRR
jgi:hypothetical protein